MHKYLLVLRKVFYLLILSSINGLFNQVMAFCDFDQQSVGNVIPLPSQVTVPVNRQIGEQLAIGRAIVSFYCRPFQNIADSRNGYTNIRLYTGNLTTSPMGAGVYSTTVPGVGAKLTVSQGSVNGQLQWVSLDSSLTNVSRLYFELTVELIKIGEIANNSVLSSYGSVGGRPVTGFAPLMMEYEGSLGQIMINTVGTSAPITFNVEQPRASCRLTNPNFTVPLKDISINTLNRTTAFQSHHAGNFNIGIFCSANARVTLAFTDAYNSYNSLLQLNSNYSNTSIPGVALNILPGQPYSPTSVIKSSINADVTGNTNYNIPFNVYYQKTVGPAAPPAEFTSMSNFTLTVQ